MANDDPSVVKRNDAHTQFSAHDQPLLVIDHVGFQ